MPCEGSRDIQTNRPPATMMSMSHLGRQSPATLAVPARRGGEAIFGNRLGHDIFTYFSQHPSDQRGEHCEEQGVLGLDRAASHRLLHISSPG